MQLIWCYSHNRKMSWFWFFCVSCFILKLYTCVSLFSSSLSVVFSPSCFSVSFPHLSFSRLTPPPPLVSVCVCVCVCVYSCLCQLVLCSPLFFLPLCLFVLFSSFSGFVGFCMFSLLLNKARLLFPNPASLCFVCIWVLVLFTVTVTEDPKSIWKDFFSFSPTFHTVIFTVAVKIIVNIFSFCPVLTELCLLLCVFPSISAI